MFLLSFKNELVIIIPEYNIVVYNFNYKVYLMIHLIKMIQILKAHTNQT